MTAAITERGGMVVKRRKLLGGLFALGSTAMGVVLLFPLLRSLGPSRPRRGCRRPTDTSFSRPTGGRAPSWSPSDGRDGARRRPRDRRGAHRVPQGLRRARRPTRSSSSGWPSWARSTPLPLGPPGRTDWGVHGYVAYSKMCTHLGCPVGLYQEQTQQLVCPCHQSIFNVNAGAVPEFGPAPRPAAPVAPHGGLRRVPAGQGRLRPGRRPRILGASMIDKTIDNRCAGWTTAWAWPRAAAPSSTRSSPTTGRSCWARSPSTRSWCCWPPACSSRLYYVPSAHEIVYHG